MDFTLDVYRSLLMSLLDSGYQIISVSEYKSGNKPDNIDRQILLRHDVDLKPERSLTTACLENRLGVKGTYYFRITPKCYIQSIIKEIESMGHEIGYHYEDLDLVGGKSIVTWQKSESNGERNLANLGYVSFKRNLALLREIVPVKTICMHGSPMSRYDSRLLWKYFDYSELGIDSEPYFDLSLDKMLYLTDTGRRWDGAVVSIRDKVYSRSEEHYTQWARRPIPGSAMAMTPIGDKLQREFKFRKTSEILISAKIQHLPQKMLLTLHPQRWNNQIIPWMWELVAQNLKNKVKYIINRRYIS